MIKDGVIYKNVTLGKGAKIQSGVIIGLPPQGARDGQLQTIIGDNAYVRSNSVISPGNKIGNSVKIHCGCFIERSVLEDNVFLGPQVVIVDDLHPVCSRWKDCVGGAKIGKNTSIGGNVTILPGVEIGHDVLVGAGSMVTKNIPDKTVAYGNPARVIKKISGLKCKKSFFKKPYERRKSEN